MGVGVVRRALRLVCWRLGRRRPGWARTRRKPPSGVRPSRWRLGVRALARHASQAKRPHPWGLVGAIHGACGPGPSGPAPPIHHPAGAVGWLFKGKSSADQRSAPTNAAAHGPPGMARRYQSPHHSSGARCFRSHEPPLLPPLSGGPAAPAGNCPGGGEGAAQDRWRHGWRHRAPRDGFTACPAQPPLPLQPDTKQGAQKTPR